MPQSTPSNTPRDHLVRVRDAAVLPQLVQFIEVDLRTPIARRLGPATDPHTLVVAITDDQAALLRQRFGNQVIVEPDRPLSLYEDSHERGSRHGTEVRCRKQ
jgi:hypothetical protein